VSQDDESFLSRWSRRKREAGREEAGEPAPAPTPDGAAPQEPAAEAAAPGDAPIAVTTAPAQSPADLPPELPPLESLDGLRSDYLAFLDKAVDEDTRRSALKKLFGDPHFNQMDGLDVYIDDYTQFEPLPAAMRLTLKHAREFLLDSERAAMGLGPTHPVEGALAANATPAAATSAPGDPESGAGAVTDGAAPGTLVADGLGTDAAAAADGTTAATPATGEALAAGLASTDDQTLAMRLNPPARDPASGSAAPPSSAV
jgi:hypothetical protein